MSAIRPRSEAEVADFLRDFREFLVKEWARYACARVLAEAEQDSLGALANSRYAPLDPERLPDHAFGEYRYESPRGYWSVLEVTPEYSSLEVYRREWGGAMYRDFSTGYELADALVELYRHGLGPEPLEGLARSAASKGVPEVARALKAAADLYRASEPYVAAELASSPVEPPEEFKEHVASEVFPLVERAAGLLATGYYRDWHQVEAPWRFASLSEHLGIDILVVLWQFENREGLAEEVAAALEQYRVLRAMKAVLRTALAMGLLE